MNAEIKKNYEQWEDSGETGGIADEQYFGKVAGEAGQFIKQRGIGKSEYNKADVEGEIKKEMEAVREFQPTKDPARPSTLFTKRLHGEIATKLNLENHEQLKFYTGVGSKLDGWGVDGFFEIDLGNGERVAVTLDGTNNPEKVFGEWKNINADFPFLWPQHSRDENKDAYDLEVEKIADMVAEKFYEKAKTFGKESIPSLSKYEIEESERMAQREKRRRELRPKMKLHNLRKRKMVS